MFLFSKIRSNKADRQREKEERNDAKYNSRQKELELKYKNEKQKSDFKSLFARLKFETYTKRLVAIIVFVGLFDLQLSYILAFLGKDQIAETLSTQVCVTLLGTVLVYIIRAYFDTREEKRIELIKSGIIVDKETKIIPDEVIKTKVKEVINNSGLAKHIGNDKIIISVETENPNDSK